VIRINKHVWRLHHVLATLVETAARLCDAEMASISRREGELFRFATEFGYPQEYRAWRQALGAYHPEGRNVGSRAVTEGCTVHVHDAAAEPDYPTEAITLGRQRTSLGVPLLREGEAIGFIVLARQRVEPFTDRQIELVSTFADQAVIAIENTRLITEQREALEQQTAMAEVLAVINANPGELGPVFDMILEKAHRLCDIGMGALLTCEAGQYRAVATRGYSPEADAHSRSLRPIPDNLAALAKSGAVRHHPDVSRADSPLSNTAFGRTFIALTGARTFLVVPLSREGTLLGIITAVRREVRPFTERQIALMENFAAQAVIAMENARLLNEQREALEQQTATAEVLGVINASPGNLAPVFDAILEKAHSLCGAAVGALMIYDGQKFHAAAAHGFPEQHAALVRQPFTPGSQSRLLIQGERFLHIPDMKLVEERRDDEVHRSTIENAGVRTGLAVPLRRDGNLLGYISAFRLEVRLFSDREIALLENFAAQAVIAMENARLVTEQREALDRQTATAEVLQVINASPGDLTPVFDSMLEKAMRLCEAAFGSLYHTTVDASIRRPSAACPRRMPRIEQLLHLPHGLVALLRDSLRRSAPSMSWI
jgi:GAF domain-containing protein